MTTPTGSTETTTASAASRKQPDACHIGDSDIPDDRDQVTGPLDCVTAPCIGIFGTGPLSQHDSILSGACSIFLEQQRPMPSPTWAFPEAAYHLAHATLFLATSPKSNSVGRAISAAKLLVEKGPTPSVPLHPRGIGYRGAAEIGHGEGYEYSHDHPGGVVAQRYFPEGVPPTPVYHPGDLGREEVIKERLEEIDRVLGRDR